MKILKIFTLFILMNLLIANQGISIEASPTTVFYVVRHGQTDWNLAKRKQGHMDIPLNASGRAEAIKLAELFQNIMWDTCYSSDLKRAFETASILLQESNVPINVDTRLRERHFGHWEGRFSQEFDNALPEEKLDVETDDSLQDRLFQALNEIKENHFGQNILVVTHAGLMRLLITQILSLDNFETVELKTAASLKLLYRDSQWTLEILNGIEIHEVSPK